MFVIPAPHRGTRIPGQVPSREGMATIREASTPAPAFKASMLLEHNEPRMSPRSVVKGLGLDPAKEQSWTTFLGDQIGAAQNEIVARRALHLKFRDERMDPELRNVLFQRSMSFYRNTTARKSVTVVSVDELRKGMFGHGEMSAAAMAAKRNNSSDEEKQAHDEKTFAARHQAGAFKDFAQAAGDKPQSDPQARAKAQAQNKADAAYRKALKKEARGESLEEDEEKSIVQSGAQQTINAAAPAKPADSGAKFQQPGSKFHNAMSANPARSAQAANPPTAQNRPSSQSRTKIQTHVGYRGTTGAGGGRLHKAEEIEKAEAKGGTYHRRVTGKDGKHRYYYDPDKYAASKDAHIDGESAAHAHIAGKIHKTLGDKECGIEHFKELALKHGSQKVADVLRKEHQAGNIYFAKGKFKSLKNKPVEESGKEPDAQKIEKAMDYRFTIGQR